MQDFKLYCLNKFHLLVYNKVCLRQSSKVLKIGILKIAVKVTGLFYINIKNTQM